MRRLTRLLNKLEHSSKAIPQRFYDTIQTLTLAPGEPIPDSVPPKSWIFVEAGCLLLKRRDSNRWACCNIYYEGTSTVFYNVGADRLEDGSYRVEAIEHSIVLYLSPKGEAKVKTFFPQFSMAEMILSQRSFFKHQERSEIYKVGVQRRIQFVEKYFPVLFRVPTDDLAELLGIQTKTLKMTLRSTQRKYHSGKVQ